MSSRAIASPALAPTRPPAPRWRDDRAGLVAAAVASVGMFLVAWLRIRNHWSGAYDLGLFDQGIWLLSRFHAPELTLLPENLFGDHLSPVLVAYVPLYWLHATPLWLVGSQALALGASVLPFRSLARQLGAPARWGTVAVVASAPIQMANLYDFHPVVLTVPVVAWGLGAVMRDDRRVAMLAAILVALARADAGVLVLGMAVLAQAGLRRRLVAIGLLSMAFGALVPALLHTDQTFVRYYASLGTGPGDALLHPWRVATTLASTTSLRTLVIWLLPVGFLPLCRPRWFAALVVAGSPLLLSTFPNTSQPWFHHAATLTPFAIGGALAAIGHHRSNRTLPALLVAGLVVALVLQGPLGPDTPRSQRFEGLARARPARGLEVAVGSVRPTDRVAADPWMVAESDLARRTSITTLRCSTRSDCGLDAPPGAAFDVVITSAAHRSLLEQLGWDVRSTAGGDVVVGQAPDD